VLSRGSAEYRVDLTTGEGLGAALEGCHVVIDATNNSSPKAAQTLVDGSRRLLEAEQAAGVRHHVGMSIVGCEKVPMGYFRVKADQERVVEHRPVHRAARRSRDHAVREVAGRRAAVSQTTSTWAATPNQAACDLPQPYYVIQIPSLEYGYALDW
jgi:hypothetical protein